MSSRSQWLEQNNMTNCIMLRRADVRMFVAPAGAWPGPAAAVYTAGVTDLPQADGPPAEGSVH